MTRPQIKRLTVISIALLALLGTQTTAAEEDVHKAAQQAVGFSAGWISGNGITYRRYFGDRFVQATFVGIVSGSASNAYVNTAVSAGTYLHKIPARGILPPVGLKILAGADFLYEKNAYEQVASDSPKTVNESGSKEEQQSFYGAGFGLDFGNPGRAGLSLWFTVNYVFAYDGIGEPSFSAFGARPSAGILYGW